MTTQGSYNQFKGTPTETRKSLSRMCWSNILLFLIKPLPSCFGRTHIFAHRVYMITTLTRLRDLLLGFSYLSRLIYRKLVVRRKNVRSSERVWIGSWAGYSCDRCWWACADVCAWPSSRPPRAPPAPRCTCGRSRWSRPQCELPDILLFFAPSTGKIQSPLIGYIKAPSVPGFIF